LRHRVARRRVRSLRRADAERLCGNAVSRVFVIVRAFFGPQPGVAMARIIVERTHRLGRDAAREKAEQLAAKLANDYGVRCEWHGDVLKVRRSGADGHIEVGQDRVRVLLNLGLLLSAMGSSIQGQIERALDTALQA